MDTAADQSSDAMSPTTIRSIVSSNLSIDASKRQQKIREIFVPLMKSCPLAGPNALARALVYSALKLGPARQ